MHIYMKIGKEKGKGFSVSWAREGDFGPAERGRAVPRLNGPRQPTKRSRGRRERTPWARAHTPERGGGVTASGGRRAVSPRRGEPVAGEPDDGSSPMVWFCVNGMVAKHGRR
jgi:hypothetical protein